MLSRSRVARTCWWSPPRTTRVDWLNNQLQLQQCVVGDRDPDPAQQPPADDQRPPGRAQRVYLSVLQVRREGLWVESTDGRGRVLLPTAYLDKRIEGTGRPTVELGRASTVYSAQGRTVDQAVMVVDENTGAEALYVGMSRGRTSNVAEAGDDTEDLADLIRAAVQSPTASEVVLDDWPHPADTAEAEVPAEGHPDPETVKRQRVEEEQEQITAAGPGQRRTGRTAAGVGRPDAAAAGRSAGDRQDRTATPMAGQTPGSSRTGNRPG